MPRLRLLCLSIDGVTEAHQVCLVTSGIGTTSRTDTRCFSTMPDTMLDRSFRNAYGSARAHSMLQSSCVTLPLPASPVLSLCSGIVGGVSLSEVLHYARRTQCLSPPNEHSPTSPNHEIKAQASWATISLEKRNRQAWVKTDTPCRFHSLTPAFLPHIALHIPLGL